MDGIKDWRLRREDGVENAPKLWINKIGDKYIIIDSRNIPGASPMRVVDRKKASAALTAAKCDGSEEMDWAIENKLGVK